jgi:hypothetical protein
MIALNESSRWWSPRSSSFSPSFKPATQGVLSFCPVLPRRAWPSNPLASSPIVDLCSPPDRRSQVDTLIDCGTEPTSGALWPKEGRKGLAGAMEESIADELRLRRATRSRVLCCRRIPVPLEALPAREANSALGIMPGPSTANSGASLTATKATRWRSFSPSLAPRSCAPTSN